MPDVKYITNGQWRNLTYGYELTEAERADFDYIEAEEFDTHDFLRYRGRIYDMDDFLYTDDPRFDGVLTDTYFSGIGVKMSDDGDQVVVTLILS
jgi:hypothetical protein